MKLTSIENISEVMGGLKTNNLKISQLVMCSIKNENWKIKLGNILSKRPMVEHFKAENIEMKMIIR